jgi:hypothetical protein
LVLFARANAPQDAEARLVRAFFPSSATVFNQRKPISAMRSCTDLRGLSKLYML